MDVSNADPAILDALCLIQDYCPQMLGIGKGLCGKPVSVFIVNHKNLVCDMFLVGTCSGGHRQNVPVIDD